MSLLSYLDELGSTVKNAATEYLGVDLSDNTTSSTTAPEQTPDQTAAIPDNKLPITQSSMFEQYKTPIYIGAGVVAVTLMVMAVRK